MTYTKILKDGTEVKVPEWHGYCEKHKSFFLLRIGCDQCRREEKQRLEEIKLFEYPDSL